jgi:hypothetical protein
MSSDWLADARRASQSRDAFEQNFHLLPGKVKSLLKHLDPRSKSSRNTDKDIAKMSEDERQCIDALLKYHQAFPLKHNFPKPRHQSKYKGKAKNMNHLIEKDKMKGFDKRG